MSQLVVDASVIVKWFLVEEFAAEAVRLKECRADLAAPDLVYAEVGNVVWKHWRRHEIDRGTADEIVEALQSAPIRTYPIHGLFASAWPLAARFERSFYDCVYLALAEKLYCRLVTADRKFYDALKHTPAGGRLLWVADIGSIA